MALQLLDCAESGFGRVRLAGGTAGSGDGCGLRSFGGRSHCWIPVKNAAATVACEHLALTELVPQLGANTHAAADALLIAHAG